MKNITPKISVIIRTYNSAGFIHQTINSALKQTLSRRMYEILVVDDGSTDHTVEILKTYKNQIKVIKLKHSGKYINVLNKGVIKAKGQYIIILDSDDLFEPEILEQSFNAFKNNKNIGFVYSDYYEKDLSKGTTKIVSLKKNIFNSIAGGMLIKKKLIARVGYYDEKLFFPEYDLLIKLLEIKKIKSVYLPLPLYIYNRQSTSVTANKNLVKQGLKQLKEKYGKNFPIRKY